MFDVHDTVQCSYHGLGRVVFICSGSCECPIIVEFHDGDYTITESFTSDGRLYENGKIVLSIHE